LNYSILRFILNIYLYLYCTLDASVSQLKISVFRVIVTSQYVLFFSEKRYTNRSCSTTVASVIDLCQYWICYIFQQMKNIFGVAFFSLTEAAIWHEWYETRIKLNKRDGCVSRKCVLSIKYEQPIRTETVLQP
jgi:hypothetical protein